MDAPQQHPDAVSSWRRVVLRYADGCELILDGTGKDDAPYISGPEGNLHKGFKCDIKGWEEKLAQQPEPKPQVTDFAEAVRARIAELNAKVDALAIDVDRQKTIAQINYLLAQASFDDARPAKPF